MSGLTEWERLRLEVNEQLGRGSQLTGTELMIQRLLVRVVKLEEDLVQLAYTTGIAQGSLMKEVAALAKLLPTAPEQPPLLDTPVLLDYEKLYNNFPRRFGKKRGLQICRLKIRSQVQYNRLATAIANYAAHCVGKETQYVKHFDTFMGCWEDWVTPEKSPTVVHSDGLTPRQRKEREIARLGFDPEAKG